MNQPENETESTLPVNPGEPNSLTRRIKVSITESLQLYRNWWKEIALGIIVRLVTLGVILYIASVNPAFPDINDMNELLTQGIVYMFQGLNPYNRDYLLSALAAGPCDTYPQNFINYGPGSLLIHIPSMIFPYSFDFAGCMDFQPSFMVLHTFFDFLIFDRMMRKGYRVAAIFVWINPVMVTLNFVTHMSVVLFFVWMGYENWKNPFWSIFWLGLGAISYQYVGLLLLFAIAYHFRSYKKWILGVLPSVTIFGLFQIWASFEAILYSDPSRHLALIHDLLLVQFGRSYEVWPLHIQSWWSWTGSIPAILFNIHWIRTNLLLLSQGQPMVPPTEWVTLGDPLQQLTRSVTPPEGIRISTVFTIFAVLISIILILKLLLRTDFNQSIKYGVLSLTLFLLGSPAGIWHHNFVLIIPTYFLLVYTTRFRTYGKQQDFETINSTTTA